MSSEKESGAPGKEHVTQESRRRLRVDPVTQDGTEPVISEDDNLFDETIRHTVPPPAQENLG